MASSTGRSSLAAKEPQVRIPLSTLEDRIPKAPGFLADESAIEEAIEAVRAARDRTGLGYTYSNALGPANLIVTGKQDNFVVRYEQLAGLSLPLGGSKISQQLSVLSAQEREQLAVIAVHETGRVRLAQLRNAYVQYWSYLDRAHIAQTYLDLSRSERDQAEALRRSGFTTAADLLDFLNSVQKVQSESEAFRSSARAQLALIGGSVGSEIPPFQPVAPLFFRNCIPDRTHALESAYRVDTVLAQYDANTVQVQEQLARIHGATIDGGANAGAGTVTDINHRALGYSLKVGVQASFPTHARDEERALRSQYDAELKTLALRQAQRRIEIASSVDSILDDIESSRIALKQALADQGARESDLRNANIRFSTLRQTSDVGFNDVSARRNELYIAQRTSAEVDATLLLKANDLLMVAPGACGSAYTPIPHWTLSPTAHPSTPAPSATTRTRSALPAAHAPTPGGT